MDFLGPIDLGLLYKFETFHRPWLDPIVIRFSNLGNRSVLLGVLSLGILVFVLLRRPRLALALGVAGVLGFLLSFGLKPLILRERPDVAWRLIPLPAGASFPSAHAFNSLAIYGTLSLLVARLLHSIWLQLLVGGLGIGLAILLGMSRIYLGVHWPVDVLAGWLGGALCLLVGLWIAGPVPITPVPLSEVSDGGAN
jgi:undecaprenyl-diphosphatase